MSARFVDILKSWEGKQVTIINPQSYTVSKITDGISFESYSAALTTVADDYIKVTFSHRKLNEDQPVEQIIPLHWIKRVSVWGDQHYIQL